MSTTPRTDAQMSYVSMGIWTVDRDFARTLETELQQAQAALAAVMLERDAEKLERQTVFSDYVLAQRHLNGKISDYLNEPYCCSGERNDCGGVSRLQQLIMEEAAKELNELRAQLADCQSREAKALLMAVKAERERDELRGTLGFARRNIAAKEDANDSICLRAIDAAMGATP